jgi:hypothetical protein
MRLTINLPRMVRSRASKAKSALSCGKAIGV